MTLVYEEYLVTVPRDELMASFRESAPEQRFVVEEDSTAGLFLSQRLKSFWSWPTRLAISVEESPHETNVRFVGWSFGRWGGAKGVDPIFGFLSSLPPGVASTLSADDAMPPGHRFVRLSTKPPSWVRWVRWAEYTPWFLIAPFFVASFFTGFRLLAVLWLWIAWLVPILVLEIVPRRKLGIRSMSGLAGMLWVSVVVASIFTVFFLL